MPQPHYPPAYLRYLKARLWNLARPGFWGTAIFLSVVGLVIKEYWTNPNLLTSNQENRGADNANSSMTPEDKAIAADIDNLPLLVDNSVTAGLSGSRNPNQNDRAKNSKSLLENLKSITQNSASDTKSKSGVKSDESAPTEKIENPFLTQAESLLKLGNQDISKLQGVNTSTSSQPGVGQTSLGLDLGLNNRTNFKQDSVPESALQTALNQSTQNQSNLNSTTSTQVNPYGSSIQQSNGISSQNSTPNNRIGTNASNSSNPGLGYVQPGLTTQPQNTLPGITGSTQQGFTNQPPIVNSNPRYIQPGIVNQPQNPFSGTGYVQQGQTNLIPQNPSNAISNTQQIPVNQLQNPTSGTGYTQPKLTNQPQNPVSGTGYVQQGQNYQPQSFYTNPYDRRLSNYINRVRSTNGSNDVYGTQALPTQQTPVAPAPTTAPYYNQIPTQGNVTNPVIPTTQVPQYNSYPGQFPGQ